MSVKRRPRSPLRLTASFDNSAGIHLAAARNDMRTPTRAVLLLVSLLTAACGAAPGYAPQETVTETSATTDTPTTVTVHRPGEEVEVRELDDGERAVVVVGAPAPAPAQPAVVQQVPAPQVQAAAPTPAPSSQGPAAAFTCSGNQRLRIHNRHVDGNGGVAVYATDNCHVVISEVILRGEPAVVAMGNARVDVVETRIWGDLVSSGNAAVNVRGSRHHSGQVLRN
jgi:hypothetical protein